MTRLIHLMPIIVIVAAVSAGLKIKDGEGFTKEFLKAGGSLLAGYLALAAIVFLLGMYL